jgi:hypothetical protein
MQDKVGKGACPSRQFARQWGTMIDTGRRAIQRTGDHSGEVARLVGLAICVLLWVLYIPYRAIYLPNGIDIPDLADGLLLAPDASWQDWFTRGYSHFFDLYPEWPYGITAFARPVFHFLIYIAHFALDRDWASYQVINCLAVAGMGALAFRIANAVLGLRIGLSILAAVLVVLSPPVLYSWLLGLPFADEPLASVFVAGAFIAIVSRRDFLCLVLLFMALFTKENAVWAPLAAALTIFLRPKLNESLRHQAFTAALMFMPIAIWLGLRFAFFNGIGGTYATRGYSPFVDFLRMTFDKLIHLHHLFVTQAVHWTVLDWGIAFVVYVLLSLLALRVLPEAVNRIRFNKPGTRGVPVSAVFLTTLWAALALVFHFGVPLPNERYATSVVVFAWPALVAEVARSRRTIISCSLAVCCGVSLVGSSYRYTKWITRPPDREQTLIIDAMHQVPSGIRQVYVLSTWGTQYANPESVRLVLGISAEIVRVVDIDWDCSKDSGDLVGFNYKTVGGVVDLMVALPPCARFRFLETNPTNGPKLVNGHIYRSDTISYEVPEAHPIKQANYWEPAFDIGRTMTVHVRTNGPARFIIGRGGPNGIAWFDTGYP